MSKPKSLTSEFVNKLLYSLGVFCFYDLYYRSKWRVGYHVLVLCTVSVLYFATTFQQIENQSHVRDHSLDLARLANNVILTLSYLYYSGLLIGSMVRYQDGFMEKGYALQDSTSKEMDLLKIRLGVKRADYDQDDTARLICYILVFLGANVLHYFSLKLSNLTSFPLGNTLVTNCSYFLCSLMEHSYVSILKKMADQFQVIERMLLPLLLSEEAAQARKYDNPVMQAMSKRTKVETLRILFCLHRKCVSMCRLINKIFSIQSFFSIALSFALVITFLFLGSLIIIQKARGIISNFRFWLLMTDVIIMIVIHLVKLLYLISVCDDTCLQAERILQLGRKVLIEDKCPELNYELSNLVKILKEDKVVFTAHDFFPIDYPLFISFIGAATTYWVIMVQFQLSPSS